MNKTLAIGGIALLAFAPLALRADSAAGKAEYQTTTAPAKHMKVAGVPNFGKLNNAVWRSGQPSQDGYKNLAKEGLRTVVNLREEFPQDKEMAEAAGLKYVYIPIKDDHAPTEEQGKQFVALVSDPANWPILVHCKGGEGRAGTMAAITRHSFDGWNHDLIMREVDDFKTRHMGFIKMPMAGCQQAYIRNWESTPAVAIQAAAVVAKADDTAPKELAAAKP